MSELDHLRGLLPDAEVAELETFLAEVEDGTAARKAAEYAVWERLLAQRKRERAEEPDATGPWDDRPRGDDMTTRHPHGRISPAEYERMAANLPASALPSLRLLVDWPAPVRAAARYEDDDDGGEFAHLWPGAAAERHEAERIAASRGLTDDEVYEAIYGADGQGDEVRNPTHLVYTGSHTHAHSDGQGGTHTHEHLHSGDSLHTGLSSRAHRGPGSG